MFRKWPLGAMKLRTSEWKRRAANKRTGTTIAKRNNQSVKSLGSRNAALCMQRPLKEPLNGGGINRFSVEIVYIYIYIYIGRVSLCVRPRQTAVTVSPSKRINLQNINSPAHRGDVPG